MSVLGFGLGEWGQSPWGSATPAGAMSLIKALAISTNEVEVTLTKEPLHDTATVAGDALNPTTWTIQRLDNAEFLTPVSVVAKTATTFVITVLQPFGPVSATHRVSSTTLLTVDATATIQPPTSADFLGVLAEEERNNLTNARQRSASVRDVANLVTPNSVFVGGTLVINEAGDYVLESGAPLLRKLITRRLVTQRGAFFHLPDYGAGLPVKGLVTPSGLAQLKAEIERQVLREPEVEVTSATILLSGGMLTIKVRAKLRNTGEELEMGLTVQPQGVAL